MKKILALSVALGLGIALVGCGPTTTPVAKITHKDTGPAPILKDTGPGEKKDTGPGEKKDTGPAKKDTGPGEKKDTGPAKKDTGPKKDE